MRFFFLSPFAVLIVVLAALAALSHAEPELDRLCQKQMVRNGFTQQEATNACARF